MQNEGQEVYTRVTGKIIADLEQGVRTWMKPWNAGNTAGREGCLVQIRRWGVRSRESV